MERKTFKIATYGSLRKGEYNYERFKQHYKDNLKHLWTSYIKGWDLFDLGAYPGIKKSKNISKHLIIDVMECSDECFAAINAMEIGAGYRPITVTVQGIECTIYEYMYEATALVEGGDWSVYMRQTSPFQSALC